MTKIRKNKCTIVHTDCHGKHCTHGLSFDHGEVRKSDDGSQKEVGTKNKKSQNHVIDHLLSSIDPRIEAWKR